MKYPKINTLWKRDDRGKILQGEYSDPVFQNIKEWTVTEKVDGTNIRVYWWGTTISFEGRTDNAEIPKHLLKKLKQLFTGKKMKEVFGETKAVLYGEGYGYKIQKGYNKKEAGFILFDALVDTWWLERENVVDIARKLDIEVVPQIELTKPEECVKFVQSGDTFSSLDPKTQIEGIVATPNPLVLSREGVPVKFKLKCKDYKEVHK